MGERPNLRVIDGGKKPAPHICSTLGDGDRCDTCFGPIYGRDGKRNFGVPRKPAKQEPKKTDWLAVGYFTLFAVSIAGIWLMLYLSAHP
jgi:hypothetical protein